MTAAELAVVVATVLCALAFAALVLVLARVLQALRTIDAGVATVRASMAELTAATGELRDTVSVAADDLDRFDRVLGSVEAISTNVEGATRVARVALSRPIIKTVALASGTSTAARRLRQPKRGG